MRKVVFITLVIMISALATVAWRFLSAPETASDSVAMAFDPQFQLTDQDGHPARTQDFKGRYIWVYFGFTFCPDICPTELQKMAQAYDALTPQQQSKIRMVFITLDPARDHPAQLKKYLALFHAPFTGLTGTLPQIQAVAKNYRVFFEKTGTDDHYMINHTSLFYLIDPMGQAIGVLKSDLDAEILAKNLSSLSS